MRTCGIGLIIGLLSICSSILADDSKVDFEKQIAPIFEQHCLRCHSPGINKGEISLATIADLKSNEYVVAGDLGGSYLIELVTGSDGKPPTMPKEAIALSDDQVALLRRWIEQGANWPDTVILREKSKADTTWWSLQRLQADETKSIDDFIREKLIEQKLTMNRPTDRRTLIRRATYDLIGLPPTPAEVEAFVTDPDPDSNAYKKLIDRLLESPHYGERWGRHWLDVVRFGESNGFERNVIINDLWPFRDYVIKSINEDKPFDQFIREHIAGDVIGQGNPNQEIGAAFLVAGPYDNVGNQDPVAAAQIRANTIDEIIRATGESFLGMTLGCARCHDHKFDPLTQEDYYGWYATFAGVRHGSTIWATPQEREANSAKLKPLNERKAILTRQQQELNAAITKRLWQPDRQWPRGTVDAKRNEETFLTVKTKFVRFSISLTNQSQPCLDELEIYGPNGKTNLALSSAGSQATASSLLPGYAIHQIEHLNDGKHGNSHSWISKDAKGWAQIELARTAEVNRVVWGRDREGKYRDRVPIEYSIEVSVDGKTWREVAHGRDRKPVNEKQLTNRSRSIESMPELAKKWKRPSVSRLGTTEKFTPIKAKFVRLVCLAQDINPESSSGFRIDEFEIWSFGSETKNVALAASGGKAFGKAREIKDFPGAYGPHLAIDGKTGERFLAAGNDLTIELAKPTIIDCVTFSSARGESTPEHRKFVFVADYQIEVSLNGKSWRKVADGNDRKPVNNAHRKHRFQMAMQPTPEEDAQLKQIAKELTIVSREITAIPKLRTAWLGTRQPANGPFHVFLGGSPQKKGGAVVPASLRALVTTAPTYRLTNDDPESQRRRELADWITSSENPLSARVLANRIWQHHFGTGIVDTPNDFGYMGVRPTHPELLDYLALRLRKNGWRMKPIHRIIMLSQAYRQSSEWHEEAANIDGDSRFLWRFPPRRLSAEEVRDTMLQVAGKLNRSNLESLKPEENETTNTNREQTVPDGGPGFRLYEYQQDNVATYVPLDKHGPETYRRAVYHQNARASVVDLMTEFDQPDCAYSVPRRAETTTPLQALTLLNHSFTLDMAQGLSERLKREAGESLTEQVNRAYQLCYSRSATRDEITVCRELIEQHGLAALCRVLLNTSEMIYVK